jgi:hypothetical protein
MTVLIVLYSNGIDSAVDPTLVPPQDCQNLTPNQRTFATISWKAPPGIFYPSYNLYYRRTDDSTFRVINNIQGYQYKLSFYNNPYMVSNTAYVFQVSGSTSDGRESPLSVPVPAAQSILTQLDPKRAVRFNQDPGKAISGVACATNSRRLIACSWTVGSNPLVKVNVRAKCTKPSGHLAIQRVTVRRAAFVEFYGLPPSSTCRILVRPWYKAITTIPPIRDVRGKKYRFVVSTLALLPSFG